MIVDLLAWTAFMACMGAGVVMVVDSAVHRIRGWRRRRRRE